MQRTVRWAEAGVCSLPERLTARQALFPSCRVRCFDLRRECAAQLVDWMRTATLWRAFGRGNRGHCSLEDRVETETRGPQRYAMRIRGKWVQPRMMMWPADPHHRDCHSARVPINERPFPLMNRVR